jgi:hypothetical protein
MLRGVAEARRILGVDRDQVKTWAYLFRDYLSNSANPPSGQPRQFTEEDLVVLMHVVMHWGPDPDIESIRASLNCEEHVGNDLYRRTLHDHTPILQDAPDWLDETWTHGVFLNGGGVDEYLALARSYRHTAETLLETALQSNESQYWAYPVLYAYRHTLELYLKILAQVEEHTHSLQRCVELLERRMRAKVSSPMREWIFEFDEIDPSGTSFRYADDSSQTMRNAEYWVDFHHLKYAMDRVFLALDMACLDPRVQQCPSRR